jgi:hypothetical protein
MRAPASMPLSTDAATPSNSAPGTAMACPYASRCAKKHLVASADRGRCEKDLPGFRNVGDVPGHVARCWLFGGGA